MTLVYFQKRLGAQPFFSWNSQTNQTYKQHSVSKNADDTPGFR